MHLLLVEDHLPDVKLTQRALQQAEVDNTLDVVYDGVEALAYLRKEGRYADRGRPDLILLDLNMPRKDGRYVLRSMAADPALRKIPVIVLTTSGSDQDVTDAYTLGANAYIVKPVSFPDFIQALATMGEFWLSVARLPPQGE